MIAPIRLPDAWIPEKIRLLGKARRIVAAMLLGPPQSAAVEPPKLASGKAWLFAVWVLLVTGSYVWAIVGKW